MLQNVKSLMADIFAFGNTVILKVLASPVQLIAFAVFVGTTVTTDVMAEKPLLIALKAGILPVPLAASPVWVLLLLQL